MSRVYLKRSASEGWTEVVTDAREDVRFTFTTDDLENPTNYVSERSFSLTLPRCAENNAFFNQFCRLDSVIVSGGYDPTVKMRYMVMDSAGMLISTGDAVLSKITRTAYELSLTGSQARIFRRLLNSGWDSSKAAEDSEYTLLKDWLKVDRTTRGYNETQKPVINAKLVRTSWLVDNPLFDFETLLTNTNLATLYGLNGDANVTEQDAFIASLIGFAPTAQGKYKDFESETWLEVGTVEYLGADVTAYPSCLPVLCNKRDSVGKAVESVTVEDGLLEPQIGEFRSYYQQPYVYIAALWQIFRHHFAEITDGYTLELDQRWFNGINSNLARLVYTLPQYLNKHKNASVNLNLKQGGLSSSFPFPGGYVRSTEYPPTQTISGLDGAVLLTSSVFSVGDNQLMQLHVSTSVALNSFPFSSSAYDTNATYYFSGFNPLKMVVEVLDEDNNVIDTKTCLVIPLPTDNVITLSGLQGDTYINDMIVSHCYTSANGYELLTPRYVPWNPNTSANHTFYIDTDICVPIQTQGNYKVRTRISFLNEKAPFIMKGSTSYEGDTFYFYNYRWGTLPYIYSQFNYGCKVTGEVLDNYRSGVDVSLGSLFKDVTPFSVLLQHSKISHLVWQVDNVTKTVTVKRSSDAFADYIAAGITNLDKNVSTTTDYDIKPLSWESHNVVFNMADMGTDYTAGYDQRVGIAYGSKKITTQNTLNSETKELLGNNQNDTIKASAMVAPLVSPVFEILAKNINIPRIELVNMPINVSGDEQANCYGNFYYRHDNDVWQYELLKDWREANGLGYVVISDDHYIETRDGRFCWHGQDIIGNDLPVTVRPVLNTVSDGGLSVLFAPAREQYTSDPDEPSAYLYEKYWKDYVEEVYNAQNKTLEASIHLPRALFDKVRKVPLVIIDHVLYLVAEVKSWGEHNTLVRCKLRQITDITKLTT